MIQLNDTHIVCLCKVTYDANDRKWFNVHQQPQDPSQQTIFLIPKFKIPRLNKPKS